MSWKKFLSVIVSSVLILSSCGGGGGGNGTSSVNPNFPHDNNFDDSSLGSDKSQVLFNTLVARKNHIGQDFPAYGFHFNREELQQFFGSIGSNGNDREMLVLNDGEQTVLKIYNNSGSLVHNVSWFEFTLYPYDAFVSADVSEAEQRAGNNNLILKPLADGSLKITAKSDRNTNDRIGTIVGAYEIDGKLFYNQIKYSLRKPSDLEFLERERLVENKISEIISKAYNLSDYEKSKYIYDYLAKNVFYDRSKLGQPSLYNSLILNRAVCQGYAVAFMSLLNRLGVYSTRMQGYITDNGGQLDEHHEWNILQLDDGWYYVDVTWAATFVGEPPVVNVDYSHFLMSHEETGKNREMPIDPPYTPLGHNHFYNVFVNNGIYVNAVENFEDVVKQIVDSMGVDRKSYDAGNDRLKTLVSIMVPEGISSSDISTAFLNEIGDYYLQSMENPIVREWNGKYVATFHIIQRNVVRNNLNIDITAKSNGQDTSKTIVIDTHGEVIGSHNIELLGAVKTPGGFRNIAPNIYEVDIEQVSSGNLEVVISKRGYNVLTKSVQLFVNQAETPDVRIEGISHNTVKLLNVHNGDKIFLNRRWQEISEGDIVKISPPNTLIFQRELPGKINSVIQELKYKTQDDLSSWEITAVGRKITNLHANLEYRNDSTESWQDLVNPDKEFAPGTYHFRLKGRSGVLASEAFSVTVY